MAQLPVSPTTGHTNKQLPAVLYGPDTQASGLPRVPSGRLPPLAPHVTASIANTGAAQTSQGSRKSASTTRTTPRPLSSRSPSPRQHSPSQGVVATDVQPSEVSSPATTKRPASSSRRLSASPKNQSPRDCPDTQEDKAETPCAATLLKKFYGAVVAEEWDGAMETAKLILETDPENAIVTKFLPVIEEKKAVEARKKQLEKQVAKYKEKDQPGTASGRTSSASGE